MLERGGVFGHKEYRQGSILLSDYVVDSPTAQILCISSFDYLITVDKHLVRERSLAAQALTKLSSFENWTQTKFESFSQQFRIKRHKKGELILEKG